MRGKWRVRTTVVAAAVTASMLWAVVPVSAATGPVSSTPAAGTPQLANTGTTQQVRQIGRASCRERV